MKRMVIPVRRVRVLSRIAAFGALMICLALPLLGAHADAASSFADTAFQAQWQGCEAAIPNFWGRQIDAQSTWHEAYAQSPGGARLVQYFDKGRMELTRSGSDVVTNGLLTVELLRGQIQTGNATYENRRPAAIPIAGDPTNPGPTFAMIQQRQSTLLTAGASNLGATTTRMVTETGATATYPDGAEYPYAAIAAYDAATGHNVPAAFATFRAAAGMATIGLAVSEPFWTTIKVGGADTDVLAQLFERRVLTYTPANPAAYRVEFGNIGQQYFRWRYSAQPATAAPAPTGQSAVTPASRGPCAVPASANFNTMPGTITRNTPIVVTGTILDEAGRICGDGTQVIFANTGTSGTFDDGAKAPNGTAYTAVTVKNGVARAIFTYSGPAPGGNPVRVGIYAIAAASDVKNGVFGPLLVDPLYQPTVL